MCVPENEQLSAREEQARRLAETLRRQLGPTLCGLMQAPDVVELMLNADGRVWVDRLGRGMEPACTMGAATAESLIATIASTIRSTVTRENPILECELPLAPPFDGARFEAVIPPNVSPGPVFTIRRKASAVFTLDQYVAAGIMTPGQCAAIKRAVRERRNILVVGGTGTGKAQPDTSLVLTPTGFRRICDVATGDLVLCPDGKVASVTGVYPQGEKEIYRVIFEDGRTVECCEDHLWKVWTRTSTYVRGSGRRAPKPRSMGWRVVPLSEIRGWLERERSMVARTAVPLVEPCAIEMPPQDLPVPPYVLGALLGDGNFCSGSNVLISSADPHILGRIEADLPDYEVVHVAADTVDYRIRMRVRQNPSPLRVELSALGLMGLKSHEKFVPDVYKRGSAAQRLAVLQGLLDTDGSVSSGTGATFTSTSLRLAKDVQKLAWSLGGIAKISERQTYFRSTDGLRRAGRVSHRVSIIHPDVSRLFSLPRKVVQIRAKTVRHRLRIVSIKAVGPKSARCIAVDHPDRLYVTDDYVVTHNTTLTNAVLAYMAEVATAHRLVIIEDTSEIQCAAENAVILRATDTVTMLRLLKTTMRLRPDRIIVGEVRGGEALAMLKAWNTGHPGGVCTVHANTHQNGAHSGLTRIEDLIKEVSNSPMRELIAEAVDLIVSIARADNEPGRLVQEVVCVGGLSADGAYQLSNAE